MHKLLNAKAILPLFIFIGLLAFLTIGLKLNPRELPSPLVDKLAPDFRLPQLDKPLSRFSPRNMKGQVWLLNVWASWCTSCRLEHPILMGIKRKKILPVIGLDYKDKREDAIRFLQSYGDPYQLSVVDIEGKTGIDYGVYGVPETYLIDQKGIIRHKHVGPMSEEDFQTELLPMINNLIKKNETS